MLLGARECSRPFQIYFVAILSQQINLLILCPYQYLLMTFQSARSYTILVCFLHNSDRLTQQPIHIAIPSDSDVSFNQILNENEMSPTFENIMKSSAVSLLAIIHQNPRVSFRLSIFYASARLAIDVWDEGKLAEENYVLTLGIA